MKRIILPCLLVLFAMTVACHVASAHFPEGVTYLAVQFPDSHIPTIDGDLSDWDLVPDAYRIVTEDMYEQLAGMGKAGTGVDLSDMTILLMVGWNESTNLLYTGAQTFDNVHMVLRPAGDPSLMWQQDDLEIMIDIDHSGGLYAGFSGLTEEENKRQVGAQATQICVAYPNADGINSHVFMAATWAGDPPYSLEGYNYEGEDLGEGTTTYELAIVPWVDLNWMGPDQGIVGDLEEGQIVGLQYSFGDFDDPETPTQYHAFWTVSGQDETFKRAERFADFLLTSMDYTIWPIITLTVSEIPTMPGHTATVPITVDDATGIAGADMVLTYDPSPLTLTDVQTADLTSGFVLTWNEDPSGTVTIALAGTSGIAGGSGDLISLTFEVSESAPLGMVSRVRFQNCTLSQHGHRV